MIKGTLPQTQQLPVTKSKHQQIRSKKGSHTWLSQLDPPNNQTNHVDIITEEIPQKREGIKFQKQEIVLVDGSSKRKVPLNRSQPQIGMTGISKNTLSSKQSDLSEHSSKQIPINNSKQLLTSNSMKIIADPSQMKNLRANHIMTASSSNPSQFLSTSMDFQSRSIEQTAKKQIESKDYHPIFKSEQYTSLKNHTSQSNSQQTLYSQLNGVNKKYMVENQQVQNQQLQTLPKGTSNSQQSLKDLLRTSQTPFKQTSSTLSSILITQPEQDKSKPNLSMVPLSFSPKIHTYITQNSDKFGIHSNNNHKIQNQDKITPQLIPQQFLSPKKKHESANFELSNNSNTSQIHKPFHLDILQEEEPSCNLEEQQTQRKPSDPRRFFKYQQQDLMPSRINTTSPIPKNIQDITSSERITPFSKNQVSPNNNWSSTTLNSTASNRQIQFQHKYIKSSNKLFFNREESKDEEQIQFFSKNQKAIEIPSEKQLGIQISQSQLQDRKQAVKKALEKGDSDEEEDIIQFKINQKYLNKEIQSETYEQRNCQINLHYKNSQYHFEFASKERNIDWIFSYLLRRIFYIEKTIIDPQQDKEQIIKTLENIVTFVSSTLNMAVTYMLTEHNRPLSVFNKKCLNITPLFYEGTISKGQYKQVGLEEFHLIRCIGQGGFSRVYLVQKKDSGKMFALKLIDKKFIIDNKKEVIVANERNIMASISHPFLLKLQNSFESNSYLGFVMEYCAGGELFYHLRRIKRMTEDVARYYFVEICLGIDYLHKRHIIYRDIKPENIFLDIDGHVRIGDFGLSKPGMDINHFAHSFCGSPEYMAPEMLLKLGHTYTVDYYCLGALLFELVTGLPPFYSQNTEEIYSRILSEALEFPNNVDLSSELQHLLNGLLTKNPEKRLGSQHGIRDILAHSWFQSINIEDILMKKTPPPLKPNLLGFNFDEDEFKNGQKEFHKKLIDCQLGKFDQELPTIFNSFYFDFEVARLQKQFQVQSQQTQNLYSLGNEMTKNLDSTNSISSSQSNKIHKLQELQKTFLLKPQYNIPQQQSQLPNGSFPSPQEKQSNKPPQKNMVSSSEQALQRKGSHQALGLSHTHLFQQTDSSRNQDYYSPDHLRSSNFMNKDTTLAILQNTTIDKTISPASKQKIKIGEEQYKNNSKTMQLTKANSAMKILQNNFLPNSIPTQNKVSQPHVANSGSNKKGIGMQQTGHYSSILKMKTEEDLETSGSNIGKILNTDVNGNIQNGGLLLKNTFFKQNSYTPMILGGNKTKQQISKQTNNNSSLKGIPQNLSNNSLTSQIYQKLQKQQTSSRGGGGLHHLLGNMNNNSTSLGNNSILQQSLGIQNLTVGTNSFSSPSKQHIFVNSTSNKQYNPLEFILHN